MQAATPNRRLRSMPGLPVAGVESLDDVVALRGSRLVDFALFNPSSRPADIAPGQEIGTFAYARTLSHRNLFRVQLR